DLDDFLLFCYTDGLIETIDEKGNEIGLEKILDYFNSDHTYTKDLCVFHQDLIVALDKFKGKNGYHDDITMLSCRVGQHHTARRRMFKLYFRSFYGESPHPARRST